MVTDKFLGSKKATVNWQSRLKIRLDTAANFFKGKKKIILLIIVVSATTLVISTTIALLMDKYHNMRFPSIGTIQIIGTEVYGGDINTTQEGISYIDWGTLYPGTSTNRSFYIKSKSNIPIILSLKTSNLTFQNSNDQNVTKNLPVENPLNLTWNYNDTMLGPGEEIYVTLTLEVSFNTSFVEYLIAYNVNRFSFDIIIKPL